jgi:LacI family gluconate utilization system Gnt-I transcriptional repressor
MSGKRKNGTISPTLKDVAAAIGVAPITVSRALRGLAIVNDETRRKIEETAARLGYVPNEVARSLKSQRTGLIAVIVPTVSGSVFAETIDGISQTLHGSGYQMMIGESSFDVSREQDVLRALLLRRPDGVIIAGVNHTGDTRNMLKSIDVPVVEIWDLSRDPVDMVVGFANDTAAHDFIAALVQRGYRRFALASGPMEHGNRAERRADGYRRALKEAGLRPGPSIVVPHFLSILESGSTLADFIAGHKGIDCLFCSNELIAIGAVVECRRRGIRIPDDVAIVGFGDVETAVIIDPPLTTVHIRGGDMGRRAASMIIDRLRGVETAENFVDVGVDFRWRQTA